MPFFRTPFTTERDALTLPSHNNTSRTIGILNRMSAAMSRRGPLWMFDKNPPPSCGINSACEAVWQVPVQEHCAACTLRTVINAMWLAVMTPCGWHMKMYWPCRSMSFGSLSKNWASISPTTHFQIESRWNQGQARPCGRNDDRSKYCTIYAATIPTQTAYSHPARGQNHFTP